MRSLNSVHSQCMYVHLFVCSTCMVVLKNVRSIHILCCISMGLGHNGTWVESHSDLNRSWAKYHLGVIKFFKEMTVPKQFDVFPSNSNLVVRMSKGAFTLEKRKSQKPAITWTTSGQVHFRGI